jgi:hypothetical protein
MQQVLARVWTLVRSKQNGRFVGVQFKFDCVFKVGACAKEGLNGRAGVYTNECTNAAKNCSPVSPAVPSKILSSSVRATSGFSSSGNGNLARILI